MRTTDILNTCTLIGLLAIPSSVWAQTTQEETRHFLVENMQRQKVTTLQPYLPTKGERLITTIENALLLPKRAKLYPYFESAYRGSGFAAGVGYRQYITSYSSVDVRGSYSVTAAKRAESEFVSPHLFSDRGKLSILGGWRAAPEIGFYGVGPDTSRDARVNYGFERPYGSAFLTLRPTRRLLIVEGGVELTKWTLKSGRGSFPSIERVFPAGAVPGVGASTTYLHTQASLGFDWRTAADYARRGGVYRVTAHDYSDRDDRLGFRQLNYEVIQHVPILRESWVISLRGFAETTQSKRGQDVPFFLMPSLGGGSNLRGFSSWRFRDRNSLLLQGEWRIMVNRYFDSVLFYDTGKVAPRASRFSLDGLRNDYGFGMRFHTPFTTPLRIDIARSHEGTSLVFSTSSVF